MRVERYVYFQGRCEEALEFSGFSLSLTVSDGADAERLFAALSDGGTVQVPMAPSPFASRLGLVADKFGVPWLVVSQNATG